MFGVPVQVCYCLIDFILQDVTLISIFPLVSMLKIVAEELLLISQGCFLCNFGILLFHYKMLGLFCSYIPLDMF